jgi:predicted Fe-S protein YdhL (DUF1289 family)
MPAIETPCVKICTLDHAAGMCRGCGRTLTEIAQWTRLNDAERRTIIDQLPARLRTRQSSERAAG